MRAVKSKDTTPELLVHRMVHALGCRFRLHRRDLPGCPDLVFGPKRKIILVHGCFWHGHDCKRGARKPKQNSECWTKKFARNVERDAETYFTDVERYFRCLDQQRREVFDQARVASEDYARVLELLEGERR